MRLHAPTIKIKKYRICKLVLFLPALIVFNRSKKATKSEDRVICAEKGEISRITHWNFPAMGFRQSQKSLFITILIHLEPGLRISKFHRTTPIKAGLFFFLYLIIKISPLLVK